MPKYYEFTNFLIFVEEAGVFPSIFCDSLFRRQSSLAQIFERPMENIRCSGTDSWKQTVLLSFLASDMRNTNTGISFLRQPVPNFLRTIGFLMPKLKKESWFHSSNECKVLPSQHGELFHRHKLTNGGTQRFWLPDIICKRSLMKAFKYTAPNYNGDRIVKMHEFLMVKIQLEFVLK